MPFRGIGAAEKNILMYLGLASSATVTEVVRAFPKMEPKTVRRAMRSLAAKGGARLDMSSGPMTVYPIREVSAPRQPLAPRPVPPPVQALPPHPAAPPQKLIQPLPQAARPAKVAAPLSRPSPAARIPSCATGSEQALAPRPAPAAAPAPRPAFELGQQSILSPADAYAERIKREVQRQKEEAMKCARTIV